jgi:hypothetical protein
MLCACGSLAASRATLVRKYLRDFAGQRFLGQPATIGDDRRPTYYGLHPMKMTNTPTSRKAYKRKTTLKKIADAACQREEPQRRLYDCA